MGQKIYNIWSLFVEHNIFPHTIFHYSLEVDGTSSLS